MKNLYMLDTNTCSFLIRNKPVYLLDRLQSVVMEGHEIVISAITYWELIEGAQRKVASPKIYGMVEGFVTRLDDVLPWTQQAADEAGRIKRDLGSRGTPIGLNDTLIAGHAIATESLLVTDNTKEFMRVSGLCMENWIYR